MERCLTCSGSELQFAAGQLYARCDSCGTLFMNLAGNWQVYPVDESMRPMIEQSLGFISADPMMELKPQAPDVCSICRGTFEVVEPDGMMVARCGRCGALYEVQAGGGLRPIIVEAPGGGWNPEFQSLFESNLGFSRKVRRKPIGVPE
jgi:uncharacterized C2H2 Zn-finger protein